LNHFDFFKKIELKIINVPLLGDGEKIAIKPLHLLRPCGQKKQARMHERMPILSKMTINMWNQTKG
jgi:hypothetical protein